jgi:ribosome-binding ATPase YchF (GTP1/OBG family)
LITIGIIGKTNVGKTTLFNAATLLNAKISTYPFTTKEPNVGIAYVSDVCVCNELTVSDTPINSTCIDGWRYVPIRIIDVPGLVKGAWRGRGLGNRFLTVIGQADALIHVVDASGSIDSDGKLSQRGSGNPILDAIDIEMEINHWIADILTRNQQQIQREATASSLPSALTTILSGIKATRTQILKALQVSELDAKSFTRWSPEQKLQFAATLLPFIKPTLIIANKMDISPSDHNYKLLTEYFGRSLVAACSAEAELALRRAEKLGVIEYTPGQEKFRIKDPTALSRDQRKAIDYIERRVMAKWMRTGIQHALNTVVFKLLKTNMVYPVSDETKFADHHDNVLPDVYLMPDGATPFDLAGRIHTRLAENYILAVDAKTGIRLPKNYALRHRDVVKIMTQIKSRGYFSRPPRS